MKTIILAGGFGSRLSEETGLIPKPMVDIGGKPILHHIMDWYASFEIKKFAIAAGYKANVIKDYFLNLANNQSDFTIDLKNNKKTLLGESNIDWEVTIVDTGLGTLTGGRLKRLKTTIGQDTFLMTYGDGLSDINIKNLISFHKSHGKMITVSAVHPIARFGEIILNDSNEVMKFEEKPQTQHGWINGGFFVVEPEFLDLIDCDDTILEKEPLEKAAEMGELMAYRHEAFWYCMDTIRDRDTLREMWQSGNAPWKSGD
jgi:glucose-1-phosphate cytidylyltransferase